ncbi:MAG: hypothetical protein PHQ00_05400, partial [Phycisphaerae bacterium]|nr:hypothetical protein [Phycisphaerae bacterium]
MKTAVKITLLTLPIFFLAVYAVQAQESESDTPPGIRIEPAGEADRQEEMRGEDYFENLLEKIKQSDPNEAARLEKLRNEDPRAFRREMR